MAYSFTHVARILRIHAHLNGGDPSLVDSCNAANAVIAEMERRDANQAASPSAQALATGLYRPAPRHSRTAGGAAPATNPPPARSLT
jgi:hypothetical protein